MMLGLMQPIELNIIIKIIIRLLKFSRLLNGLSSTLQSGELNAPERLQKQTMIDWL